MLRSRGPHHGPSGSHHPFSAYDDDEGDGDDDDVVDYPSSETAFSASERLSSHYAVSDDCDIAPSESASRPIHRGVSVPVPPARPQHSSRSSSHRTHSTRDDDNKISRRSRRHYESPSHSTSRHRERRHRVPSDESDSLDSNAYYPPGAGHDGHPFEPYEHEQYAGQWPPAHARYPPSTAPYGGHPVDARALVPQDGYPYPPNPLMSAPGTSNPFVSSPPTISSASPEFFYEPHAQHAYQRPMMQTRRSMQYPPPDMQAMAPFYQQHYPLPPGMTPAMAAFYMQYGPPHHRHRSPSPPPKKKEPAEAPPPAPAPPPPPEKEEDTMIKFFQLMKMHQDAEKEAAEAAASDKQQKQAESDKIAALLKTFEEGRLAREKEALAKAEADKAAAEAKAAREKELSEAATAAREAAEKDAAAKAAAAQAESEKKIAEAKAAQEEIEKVKKELEEKLAKNQPDPDSTKPPLRLEDAIGRHFTLPWHLAKTWKGIEGLIKQAFLHVEVIGPRVVKGQYDLLGPNDEIILPQVWETVVQPDWGIRMILWPIPDPIDEMVAHGPGGFPDPMMDMPPFPERNKSGKPRGSKKPKGADTKRHSMGSPPAMVIPVPPTHGHPGMPPADDPFVEFVQDVPKPTKKKSKQIPAFTRWMMGVPPRPKGREKPGVRYHRVVL